MRKPFLAISITAGVLLLALMTNSFAGSAGYWITMCNKTTENGVGLPIRVEMEDTTGWDDYMSDTQARYEGLIYPNQCKGYIAYRMKDTSAGASNTSKIDFRLRNALDSYHSIKKFTIRHSTNSSNKYARLTVTREYDNKSKTRVEISGKEKYYALDFVTKE